MRFLVARYDGQILSTDQKLLPVRPAKKTCSLVRRLVEFASVPRSASTTTSTLAQWQPSPLRRRLRWDGVARAVASARREDDGCSGPSSPSREQGTASEDGDAQQAPLKSTASDLGGDEERQTVKRVVDWTLAIEELWAKRRRGKERKDNLDHPCKTLG